ncbi:hypothetical protein PoB_004556300 [Plakobranchus ocellatus]|uniref:OTU domain-containing protein n=1 Tax=Plakobranchus ocellatus TaxID=259542 RepID=A0AAV4BHH3_9GAST|nr:hypothetical protein PoB_004556300 [Plakobranchus ocellatus]
MTGLELATEGSLQISGRTHKPQCHLRPHLSKEVLIQTLCESRSEESCKKYRNIDKREFSLNFLKVNIFYEDLNYENITEQASYEEGFLVSAQLLRLSLDVSYHHANQEGDTGEEERRPLPVYILQRKLQLKKASFSPNQARAEQLMFKTCNIDLPKSVSMSSSASTVDDISVNVLKRYHPVILESQVPIEVCGDGNCLFRAVSKGLRDTKEHYMQIHLLTTLEFILNRSHYDYEHEAFVDNFNDDHLVFDRFDTVLKDIAEEFSYCSMMALSGKMKSPVVVLTFVSADDDHDDDSASATAGVACVGNDDEDDDTAAVADISDNGTVDFDEDEADD